MRPRPRVLIVEDDPDALTLFRVNLESAGFDTSLAADGGTALRRMATEGPDLILLDLMLPVMDGWAVLAQAGVRDVPVVVCTARTDPGDRSRALRLGAAAFVTKPFDLHQLIDTVWSVLEERSVAEARWVRADFEIEPPTPGMEPA